MNDDVVTYVNSERLLREVVRRVLETVATSQATPTDVDVTEDVIAQTFVPVTYTKAFAGEDVYVSHDRVQTYHVGQPIAKEAKRLGFKPADVGAFLKKGEDTAGNAHFVMTQPKYAGFLLNSMANNIIHAFKGKKIDEVMVVDSTYSLSSELARRVAEGLGVPLASKVQKETDASKFEIDPTAIHHWLTVVAPKSAAEKGEDLNVYIAKTMKYLDKDKKALQSAVLKQLRKPSIARDLHVSRRKFWNLYAEIEKMESKRVLVVDDNVSSGATCKHIANRLQAAGVEPFFAVGYYYAPTLGADS